MMNHEFDRAMHEQVTEDITMVLTFWDATGHSSLILTGLTRGVLSKIKLNLLSTESNTSCNVKTRTGIKNDEIAAEESSESESSDVDEEEEEVTVNLGANDSITAV